MPRLTFKGVSADLLCQISEALVQELADICQCGTDNFTLECAEPVYVFAGKRTGTYPFIEIAWFERGDEIRGRMAAAITRHALSVGLTEVEVAFRTYAPNAYYINGIPCE